MPILNTVQGDPTLTQAQVLAFGYNAKGRTELAPLQTDLLRKYPAAFATFRKTAHGGKLRPGMAWHWQQTQPRLSFWVVRASSVGATRLRYVESICMDIAQHYRFHGIESLAVTSPGSAQEWGMIAPILDYWFSLCELPVVVYDEYLPGVQADEGF